ncbi:hypothetical protein CSUI_002287, partial [Cystoisospora suis]
SFFLTHLSFPLVPLYVTTLGSLLSCSLVPVSSFSSSFASLSVGFLLSPLVSVPPVC